jgi:hypothetical protein
MDMLHQHASKEITALLRRLAPRSVPDEFFAGLDYETQILAIASFQAILTFFARQGRGLEPRAFRRFCGQPLIEVIEQLENVVADRLADIRKTGVDLFPDETGYAFPRADRIILGQLLRQPDDEAGQHKKRSFEVIGSFLHELAPSWLWGRA